MTYVHQERYSKAQISLQRGIALNPGYYDKEDGLLVHSNLLFLMSHDSELPAEALFAEHCRVGDCFEAGLRETRPQHSNDPNPDRRLRVGFVSGDFHNHTIACLIEPVMRLLGRYAGVELHAYYSNTVEDDVTHRLRASVHHWQPVAGLSDEELARKIMDDAIDILIDLSGHTMLNRLRTFARKPAPIQISWCGYPGTTGLQAMDYYLADRKWLPPGQFDRQFTEKLLYLPATVPFQPHAAAPPVNPLPALTNGHLTFGSFNRLGKINASTIQLWSQLLNAVPNATLLIGGMALDARQPALLAQFAAHGIARERLSFHPRCAIETYLGLHHRIDLCLDTHPYSGGTTTNHALWMGVPTLTLAGHTPAARQGAALMGHLGLDQCIAADAADFLAKGIYWSEHLPELAELRAGLRERCARSPVQQPEVIVAALERTLRHVWRRWCQHLPPESFDSTAAPQEPPVAIAANNRRSSNPL
jgi:predicted O-linked N-acetylglucosamine transferase (SPINDLY family)